MEIYQKRGSWSLCQPAYATVGQLWQNRWPVCWAAFSCLLLAILGSVSYPLRCQVWASLLATFLWGMHCLHMLTGFHLKFCDKYGGDCSQVWDFLWACDHFEVLTGPGFFILCSFKMVSPSCKFISLKKDGWVLCARCCLPPQAALACESALKYLVKLGWPSLFRVPEA